MSAPCLRCGQENKLADYSPYCPMCQDQRVSQGAELFWDIFWILLLGVGAALIAWAVK